MLPSWGDMLFQLVAFIILMLVVSRFALRPVMNTMEERQSHIENQISEAEKQREEAEGLLKKQQALLNEARTEAKEIIERAKLQKEKEAEAIMNDAQERAERMIKEATAEIGREKERALAELRNEVGHLSILLASKMIEKELDEKEQSKLINQYLNQVGEMQ